MTVHNKKILFKKTVSFLVAVCMIFGVMLQMMPVHVHAAAPTTYSAITADSTASVRITSSGSAAYFQFVPRATGTYRFYSSGSSGDPYGALLDASGTSLSYSDDASGRNFSITYDCVAGTTYYIKAYMYGSNTGSYTLNVQTVSVAPVADVLDVNTAGGTNYPLFNSGNTTSDGWSDYRTVNPAPNTYTNNGYDLYGSIGTASQSRFRLGLSFEVNIDILENAKLQVRAWDVDENIKDCGSGYEHDYIYLVDETDPTATVMLNGHMSGQNNTWNNTEFTIEPGTLQKGHTYHFELQMTCTGSHNCSYYAVVVRTVNLVVNGSSEPPVAPTTGIENAELSASISSSGSVSVNLTANSYAEENYNLEYKAVCAADSAQYGGKEYSVAIPVTSAEYGTTFQLESGAPRGTYTITVFIKNSSGMVVATRTVTSSYGYSAVSYNSNGGSQNLPSDGTTYSSGDTVTVKFDNIPSLYGYIFLGWSTDRYATEPMYTEEGTNTFTIGTSDVTLYAVWGLNTCDHTFEETSRTEATCTEGGVIVSTCTACGETEEEAIPATGHSYEEGYCTLCGAAEPQADIWDGTVDTSWYVSGQTEFTLYTAEELAGLAYLVNNGNSFSGITVRLGNDIDLDGKEWTPIGKGIGTSDTYTSRYAFYGTFDGDHNIVYNLSITSSSTSFTGFFGCLYGGTVLNLGIENASVAATGIGSNRCTAGILAGASANGVTVNNCYVTGQLTVDGDRSFLDVGCIIGDCYNARISDSYAVASVTVNYGSGGYAGGLFGFHDTSSSATNCFYYGNVAASGSTVIGAIAPRDGGGAMLSCYYNSNTTSSSATYVADENLLDESYFSGFDFVNVWEMGAEHPVLRGFGESCDHEFEETSRTEATCTADGVIVSTCTGCGATRETVIPMLEHTFEETSRTEATCTADGVIVSTCTGCGATEEEALPMIEHSYEEGYCTLCGAAEPQADIWDGTVDISWYVSGQTEFTLYTAEELAGLAYLVNSGNTFSGVTIYLGSDIDLDGREWAPIGKGILTPDTSTETGYQFRGTFDGLYHRVLNLKISNNDTTYTGFFGDVNGTVKNLGIENADVSRAITSSYRSKCGAMIGRLCSGRVENCYVINCNVYTTAISKPGSAGGLIGNVISGSVENCFVQGDVESNGHVALLIGSLYSGSLTVNNCYAIGNVKNNRTSAGGTVVCAAGILAFPNESSSRVNISNSFFVGTIDGTSSETTISWGSNSNCYYNVTSATSHTSGTVASLENLKSQAWVEANLGWDFDEVWALPASSAYPVLKGFDNISGGSGDDEEESDRHTHEFVETSRTESTCTEYGEIVYTCECGSTTTALIQPKQHNYQVTGTVDATCTENGYIEFVCENDGCGATKRQVIDAIGHDYGTDHICDRCGHTVDLHMHEYSVVTVAPTCTTMGYKEYTCHCGYSYKTSFVEPTRHNWDDGEITTEASCTAEGVTTYTCQDCGATKTTVIPSGHSWSESVTVDKTCEEDGSITKTCEVCGAKETEVIPAGHNWDEGTATLAPGCKTEGTRSCTCLDCGAAEEIVIPALGHTYVSGTCTRCGGKFIDDITPTNRPLYGMFFEIDDILSDYGPSLIDEYGLMLDYNSDATIEKVAVYLTQEGNMWRRCIAVKGTNIEYATYVPYLSYEGEIKYSGLNHDWINVFRLSENSDGIWCYNNYATIGVNLEDAYGNLLLSMYDIGQAGAETRIFDNLGDMVAWLNEDKCEHTPGEWIVDVEPTATQTGTRHKECTTCHATLETEVMPIIATLVIDSVRAEAGKTVRVTIDIQNNPGIIGAVLALNYNPALTLVNVEAGSAWNTLNFTRPSSFESPCNFVWDGVEGADFSDGTIIVLTFELPEDAEDGAVYEISASYTYGNMINADLEKVNMEIENGSVTVDNSIGDVNDDGVVDVADVVTLRRYLAGGYGVEIDDSAADMDDDGYITVADIVLLRRLLVSQE